MVGKLHSSLAIVGSLAIAAAGTLHSGDAAAQSPSAESAAEELRSERGRLWAESQRLRGEGKLAEATAVAERILVVERRWLGEDHPDVVVSFESLARLHQELEDWARAAERQNEALLWREKHDGVDHWKTIDARLALENIGFLRNLTAAQREQLAQVDEAYQEVTRLRGEGRYGDALSLVEKAVAINKEILGEKHQDYGSSLNNLALLCYETGDYAKSRTLYLQSLEIKKQVLGDRHPGYAISLDNLALVDAHMGNFAAAERGYRQAQAIKKQVFGEGHPDYAASLNNLGLLYATMGDYERAEPLYLEASEIIKAALGDQHSRYAVGLNNLAGVYRSMGDYVKAERVYREALRINKLTLGEHHPSYAISLGNLAYIYRAMDDYARAEPLYRQALAINEASLGDKHPNYARSVESLASLYQGMGDYARAEPLFKRALEIRGRALGKQHFRYATNLNNLSELYGAMGDLTRAEPLLIESLEILKKTLGEKHPDYATTLNNLGVLYKAKGDAPRAEALYREAQALRKSVVGDKHPDYAQSLNNLAALYASSGDYSAAEPLYREALAIDEASFGQRHTTYASRLNNLAALYELMELDDQAEPLYRRALEIVSAHGEATAVVESDRAQLAHAQRIKFYLDSYVGLLLRRGRGDAAYEAVLHWKGAILARQRAARMAADSPELAPILTELQSAVRQWTVMTSVAPQGDPEAWNRRRDELGRQMEDREAELIRRSAEFRAATQAVRVADVSGALPVDAALVDYFHYWNDHASSDEPEKRVWRRSLAAFVIRSNQPVQMVDLGPGESIITAIDAWRATYGGSAESQEAGRLLRERIWQPLEGAIGDAKTVLISPDGALGRLPFAALPGRTPESFLLETYRIALVPVPRLIPALLESRDDGPVDNELLLLGGVDYDDRDASVSATVDDSNLLAVAQARGDVQAEAAGRRWRELPGAADEVEIIARLYQQLSAGAPIATSELRGPSASEENFRAMAPRSRVIHLATHGFFTPEKRRKVDSDVGLELDLEGSTADVVARSLSGLVLAGANSPPSLPDDPNEFAHLPEDGILTTEEVASMRLNDVKLVVMSACDTGLGDASGGEGLLGVQRAFQIAGARTTIATLWKVDDAMTQRLMTMFYRYVLEQKQPYADALRNAQLTVLRELRDDSILHSLPRGADAPEGDANSFDGSPYYWAAFTVSGDWQ